MARDSQNNLSRFFRYVADAWRSAKAPPERKSRRLDFDDVLGQMGRTALQPTNDPGLDELARLSAVSSWVYSCLKLIADRVSGNDWFTVELGGDNEESDPIRDHPFVGMFRRPNTMMSGNFLKRYVTWSFWIYGNAYLYVVVGKNGIEELWPLPPNMVQPKPESIRQSTLDDRMVIDYIYRVNGMEYRLSGEYVIHLRTVNLFDYWVGLSPLTALQLPIRTDFSQSVWLDSYFGKDNAIPAAVISVPAEMPDDDFDSVRASLREQFGGGRRTAITRAGDMSVTILQNTIAELQVLEGRNFSQKEIDRVFGVPEGMITGGLSGDSRLAAEISFARNTVQPFIDMAVDDLHRCLAPFIGLGNFTPSEKAAQAVNRKRESEQPIEYMLKPADMVPQDRALAISDYQAYSGDRTLNENRRLHDDDPLELKGEFALLQPLIDEVPVSLWVHVAPAVIEKWTAEYNPQSQQQSGGSMWGGLFGPPSPPIPEDDEMAEPGAEGDDAEGSEPGAEGAASGAAGKKGAKYRDSGQKPPSVIQEDFAGKAVPAEIESLRGIWQIARTLSVGAYTNGNGAHGDSE